MHRRFEEDMQSHMRSLAKKRSKEPKSLLRRRARWEKQLTAMQRKLALEDAKVQIEKLRYPSGIAALGYRNCVRS